MTWNTHDITPRLLRDLMDTDHGCDLRLLVRDNASRDGTAEAVARSVPEAEIDVGDENLGFAAGVNALLARATAPWILLLNSDAWPLPGAIRALVDAAEAHPDAAVTVPRIENPDGTMQHSTHPFPSVLIAVLAALGARIVGRARADRHMLNGGWMHDRARSVDWAIGAAWLLRRRAVEELGGLDERFFMYAEDIEWCWRARKHGWQVWFEPSAIIRHAANASGAIGWGDQRTKVHARNAYRFYHDEHSRRSTFAWWGVTVAGQFAHYLWSRIRRNHSRAAGWRDQVIAHWQAPRASDEKRPQA